MNPADNPPLLVLQITLLFGLVSLVSYLAGVARRRHYARLAERRAWREAEHLFRARVEEIERDRRPARPSPSVQRAIDAAVAEADAAESRARAAADQVADLRAAGL
jgi:hypothetical protein